MAKSKRYSNYTNEAVAGLINSHCMHCGSVRILVRKQVFKNRSEHLHKFCSDCFRNNDYLPQEELPHISCFNPYEVDKESFYMGE